MWTHPDIGLMTARQQLAGKNVPHFRITSSEKVDKENRYGEFILCSIPYPGIVTGLYTLEGDLSLKSEAEHCSWWRSHS